MKYFRNVKWMMAIWLSVTAFEVSALEEFVVEIKNHLFTPSILLIPAEQKVKITFVNHDTSPEEVDSFDLNREKVVFGNSRASIYVGPLKKGSYEFFGEYHPHSAIGKVKVIDKEAFYRATQ